MCYYVFYDKIKIHSFSSFSLILLLFLQAILKRITAKEPHYNHLQWVKKSNSVVPSFFYSCNHVK